MFRQSPCRPSGPIHTFDVSSSNGNVHGNLEVTETVVEVDVGRAVVVVVVVVVGNVLGGDFSVVVVV